MIGKHKVIVQNKRIRYEFEIIRNITILQGDSATGKTTLVEMIEEHMNRGKDSMVDVQCDKKCVVIGGSTWKGQLSEIRDSIVFIDEGNQFVLSKEFAKIIQMTDNYYVIVNREGLPNLPYSVTEIYGIRNSGKFGNLKQTYQYFYKLYNYELAEGIIEPNLIITEDSNSGYQFFKNICDEKGLRCYSANGKSNIASLISNISDNEVSLVVVDGAAFGSEINKIKILISKKKNIKLYLPESFEWIILSSGVINDSEIKNIINRTYNYVESSDYFSWEQFFYKILVEKTNGTYLAYSKSKINDSYLHGKAREAILKIIDKVNVK
ncbi:MAG: translation initiation factor 2 [Lachnospiraceae bacterium]|nr:translation initiation factor 2 [Lachnospiraceae bacterium]